MNGIRFESTTPPIPRTAEDLTAFATALKKSPGRWALMGVETTPNTSRHRAWQTAHADGNPGKAFAPAGSFEALSRVMFGENRVYVRYTGEGL